LLIANKRLRRGAAKLNRHAETLQYWKKHDIVLIPNPQYPNPVLQETASLASCIQSQSPAELKVFTDGSTAARSTEPNSGIGVAVYDEKEQLIWKGGAGVRTDGNNFVAEVAAAALALNASASYKQLSERRNVRSSARRWVNLARTAIQERQAELQLMHVRSHQGLETFEEKGNDLVDKLANEERHKVEDADPVEYFTEGDIGILLMDRISLNRTRGCI